jgi:hypothetical protein
MTKPPLWSIVAGASLLAGIAWATDWSGAKSKADQFKSKHDDLKRQAPVEARKIVAAACAATDENRKHAAESAASDARSHIADRFRDLESLERDALRDLDWVIDKDATHKDEAKKLQDDIKSRFEKIKETTRQLRDNNYPAVAFMSRGAETAKRDREGRCDAHDISLDAGHAQCLMARGDTCYVVELAPDNSSAISRARDIAGRYKNQLENELKKSGSSVMQRLGSRFSSCKRFETRIDCFKQCPQIDDDLKFHEDSPNWRENC